MPQLQTVDWPPERGTLVFLCAASFRVQVGWVWAPCRPVELSVKQAYVGERAWEGVGTKIWAPCESKGSQLPQKVREVMGDWWAEDGRGFRGPALWDRGCL